MLRSMYSGVAGLKTHQTKMDVIGNNIANVNTTSFKSQNISFSDLMYQTTQNASGATETTGGVNARQIGLGAQSAAIATAIETQGATQTTNNPYDLMITGDAFFIVNDGTQNVYTRDGSFYVDGQGNLATQSDGYYVMGWMATTDEDTGVTSVNTNGGLTSLQIISDETSTYPPEGTSQAVISGNIDAKDSNITSSAGKTIALEFYDNLGYLYTAEFTIKDVDDELNTYTMTLSDIIDSDGESVGAEQLANVHLGNDTQAGVTTPVPGVLEAGYYVSNYSASKGTADFSTKDDVAYESVPISGALSDLDDIGILEDLYNINIDVEPFYAADTYTMDELGNLTISHVSTTYTTSTKEISDSSYNIDIDDDDETAILTYTKSYATLSSSSGKVSKLTSTIQKAYSTTGIDVSGYTYYEIADDGSLSLLKSSVNAYSTDDDTVIVSDDSFTIGSCTYDSFSGNISDLSDDNKEALLGACGLTSVSDYATYEMSSDGTLTITNYVADGDPYSLLDGYTVAVEDDVVSYTYTKTIEDIPIEGDMTDLASNYSLVLSAFGITSSDYDTSEPADTYVINDDGTITITDNSYKTVTTEYNRNEMTLNYDHATGAYTGATFKQADGTKNGITYSTITTDKIVINFNPDMEDGDNPWTDVYLDLSTTTNYNSSGTSTLQASKGDLSGNNTGRMMGKMTGISISKDGKISASYSNGQTLLLAQIASATFANASGLEKAGNNLYSATLNSGDPVVADITVGGGSISTGVLEMSNVDLSSEFTNMITAQRGFQANSRIITVSDTLLEELTNLKR